MLLGTPSSVLPHRGEGCEGWEGITSFVAASLANASYVVLDSTIFGPLFDEVITLTSAIRIRTVVLSCTRRAASL
jgi:hypothetical protein